MIGQLLVLHCFACGPCKKNLFSVPFDYMTPTSHVGMSKTGECMGIFSLIL